MHRTTAKLITLERIEDFLARGLRAGPHQAATNQAKALRQELPPDIIAAYGEIKARHKEAVVGVFENRCGGCRRPLSGTSLERLGAEREVSRCEHCGRFIYVAPDLKPKSRSHSYHLAGAVKDSGQP